jgi:hypothetical protein
MGDFSDFQELIPSGFIGKLKEVLNGINYCLFPYCTEYKQVYDGNADIGEKNQ